MTTLDQKKIKLPQSIVSEIEGLSTPQLEELEKLLRDKINNLKDDPKGDIPRLMAKLDNFYLSDKEKELYEAAIRARTIYNITSSRYAGKIDIVYIRILGAKEIRSLVEKVHIPRFTVNNATPKELTTVFFTWDNSGKMVEFYDFTREESFWLELNDEWKIDVSIKANHRHEYYKTWTLDKIEDGKIIIVE